MAENPGPKGLLRRLSTRVSRRLSLRPQSTYDTLLLVRPIPPPRPRRPSVIGMEPLSPKPINVKMIRSESQSTKGSKASSKASSASQPPEPQRVIKQKDHAPPPPSAIYEPLQEGESARLRYLTGKFLGKGGFAVCYEGHNVKSDKVFALKVVKAKMSHQRMADKFRTELQIHAKMHHPNIVNFYRAFTYEESTYVVLELCQNGSVMEMVKRRKCLSLPEVRRFTIQICGAMKYMHHRNVIHRDLKMGNLFLDQNMDIKVGDFGLAAILIGKSEAKKFDKLESHRRTTMCGTPNYIAPEILKKEKDGHGHKVDVWALGVIIFAMLTGHPPFQSSSQEEIYRKVKSLEYEWPDSPGGLNYIPREAKDLVFACFQKEPEKRPDPDLIVEMPFFKMYDGCIAGILGQICRMYPPSWLKKQDPRGDCIESYGSLEFDERYNPVRARKVFTKWESLTPQHVFYAECGVGLDPEGKPFPCAGEKTHVTASMECLEEEFREQNPVVPIPEDAVYSPDYKIDSAGQLVETWTGVEKVAEESNKESRLSRLGSSLIGRPNSLISKTGSITGRPKSIIGRAENLSAAVPPSQEIQAPKVRHSSKLSHAAELRQQSYVIRPTSLAIRDQKGNTPEEDEAKVIVNQASKPGEEERTLRNPTQGITTYETSTRPTTRSRTRMRNGSNGNAKTAMLPIHESPLVPSELSTKSTYLQFGQFSARSAISETTSTQSSQPPRLLSQPSVRSASQTISSGTTGRKTRNAKPKPLMADVVTRLQSENALPDIPIPKEEENWDDPDFDANQIDPRVAIKAAQKKAMRQKFPEEIRSEPPMTCSMIDPDEISEPVKYSDPDAVLTQLETLLSNLRFEITKSSRSRQRNPLLNYPMISKWVDYTNKYGLGYMLTDGTIGALFNGNGREGIAATAVAVRGGEEHLRKKHLSNYTYREELVPQTGQAIEFFENSVPKGLRRALVDPSKFKLDPPSDEGTGRPASKMRFPNYYGEKLGRLRMSMNFGKYMLKNLSREEDGQPNQIEGDGGKKKRTSTIFVKFYQRCGNVGIFGFSDGALQFNFPDHTKFIISNDGSWIEFSHLTIADALQATRMGVFNPGSLERRQSISLSTSQFKAALEESDPTSKTQKVLKENHFAAKLEWIAEIVVAWIKNGSMGSLGIKENVWWQGVREKPRVEQGVELEESLVWVSVGNPRGGDVEYKKTSKLWISPASRG